MEVQQHAPSRTIRLHQQEYINKMLSQYHMQDCNPVATPMTQCDTIYVKGTSQELTAKERALYMSMVGSVMYLQTCCRPDIAALVGILARHVQCPRREHLVAVKRLLRYLKGTKHLGLTLGGDISSLQVYCDSDWAADPVDRRSTTGYFIRFGEGLVC